MSSSLQKVEVGTSLGSLGEVNLLELGDLKSVFDSLLSFMDLGGGGRAFFLVATIGPSSLGRQPGYCPIFTFVFMTCASFARCSPLSSAYCYCLSGCAPPMNRSFVVAYCGCLWAGPSAVKSLSTIPWTLAILCSLPESAACFTTLYPRGKSVKTHIDHILRLLMETGERFERTAVLPSWLRSPPACYLKSTSVKSVVLVTKHVSVGVAGPLLELDGAAGQVLPKLHPPLGWQVLDCMLLAHVGVTDPEGEGVGWEGEGGGCGTRGLTTS